MTNWGGDMAPPWLFWLRHRIKVIKFSFVVYIILWFSYSLILYFAFSNELFT